MQSGLCRLQAPQHSPPIAAVAYPVLAEVPACACSQCSEFLQFESDSTIGHCLIHDVQRSAQALACADYSQEELPVLTSNNDEF